MVITMAAKAKTTKKKAATKKAAPAKKATKKTAKKAVAKKTSTKKTAAKKAPAKKAEPKKAATAKTAAKKAPAKKKAAVKTAAKKTPAKKTATKKTATKKEATKKTAAPKAATKKTAKKAAPAKATKKKAASKKVVEKPKPRPKPKNVGQAPRKTTLAASIPVPTQIIERDASQAEIEGIKNTKEATSAKQDFKVKDKIVYPAHGVGSIVALEKQQVAGIAIELFVINFDQEKMKLRVPTGKAKAAGMRPLSDEKTIKDAITTLKGRARIKRTMWSRRAQEYDAKINSGSLKLVAEVVRDLFRAADQPEQSYSERQLFEAALDRLAREVAASRGADLGKTIEELEDVLKKKTAAAAAAAAAAAETEAAE